MNQPQKVTVITRKEQLRTKGRTIRAELLEINGRYYIVAHKMTIPVIQNDRGAWLIDPEWSNPQMGLPL